MPAITKESIDKSTWGDVDYEPLLDGIWKDIGIHSHHQQRCENYVQMSALIAKTLVGEARRTWRAIALSAVMRPFNQKAVDEKRAAEKDTVKRKKIRRVEGYDRIKFFSTFIDKHLRSVDTARGQISDETYIAIRESIGKKGDKVSAEEQKELEDEFEMSLKEDLKQYTAEQATGYVQTAIMGGTVLLRILTKTNGFENQINCEMIARKIPAGDDFIKQFGEDAVLEEIAIKDKKKYIKLHEAQQSMKKNQHLTLEEVMKKTNSIQPFSNEMKEILLRQNEILAKV